jgi:hypothetical protein
MTNSTAQAIATIQAIEARPVPARVARTLELRSGSRTARHSDQRKARSRNGCKGKALRAALREQGYR